MGRVTIRLLYTIKYLKRFVRNHFCVILLEIKLYSILVCKEICGESLGAKIKILESEIV